MNVAVALVLLPVLFAVIGYLPLRGPLEVWITKQPVALPSAMITKLVWVSVLWLFGLAATLAGVDRELLLAVAFVVPGMAAMWAYLLVLRQDARTAFTVLCIGWTLTAILAAWIYALNPGASLLTVPLLITLIVGGVVNFFIWQRPAQQD
jgi:tryptophan-rich sensory protein